MKQGSGRFENTAAMHGRRPQRRFDDGFNLEVSSEERQKTGGGSATAQKERGDGGRGGSITMGHSTEGGDPGQRPQPASRRGGSTRSHRKVVNRPGEIRAGDGDSGEANLNGHFRRDGSMRGRRGSAWPRWLGCVSDGDLRWLRVDDGDPEGARRD